MSRKFFAAMMVILLGALLIPLGSTQETGDELHPLRLYLHQGGSMDTISPEKAVPSVTSLSEGDSVDFTLTYPLAYPMTMRGYELSGGQYGVRLILEATGGIVESSATLLAHLYKVEGSSEVLLANGTFSGSQISQPVKEMPFSDPLEELHLDGGTTLLLRLTAERVQSPYRITLTYDSLTTQGRLEFLGDNLRRENLDLQVLDGEGEPLTELEPNLPAELRRVTFRITMGDSFGVYDLSTLNITAVDSGGTEQLTQRFSDFPSSGEGSYTYNYTWNYPAGIPSGDMTIIVEVKDRSGYELERNFTLPAAPCGVYLSADATTSSGSPGESVEYTFEVLNTGAENCTIALSVDSMSGGWSASVSPTSITLDGGESAAATLTVNIPVTASEGERATTTVRGVAPGGKERSLTFSTDVTSTGGFLFTVAGDKERTLQAGEYTTFELTVTNTGSTTDTFYVYTDTPPPLGWNVTLEGGSGEFAGHVVGRSATISPGRSVTFLFTVEVGLEFESPLYSPTLKCYPASQGEGSAKSITLTVRVSSGGGEILSIDPNERVQTVEVISTTGGALHYSEAVFIFDVVNTGETTWVVDLDATVPEGWDLSLRSSVTVAAGGSERVSMGVTPSSDTVANEETGYMITLTATVEGENLEDALQLWVKVVEFHKVELKAEENFLTGEEGELLKVNITLTNSGNTEEDVTLQVTLPQNTKLNVTLSRHTLLLSPGESAVVEMRAEVEGNIKEETTETVRLTAYYGGDRSGSVDVTFTFEPAKGPSPSGAVVWIVLIAVVVAVGLFIFWRPPKGGGKAGGERGGGGEEPEGRETLAGVHM
ncbi:MAG: hypothetical protein DRN42_02875 [Thermoplasmata archaeon]|nr:MAG: hypothetical protein DRN42_02875 [Thermoplasmata archaeon]